MSITPGDSTALSTKTYVICYFDIIGTKYYLSKNPNLVYSYLWGILNSLNQYKYHYDQIKVKCFSDNFIVYTDADENDKYEKLNLLATLVGHVSADCMTMFQGYPRGVITYGALHCSDDCVIGPALVKAYELEQNECFFPRIIFDETVFNFDRTKSYNLSSDKLFFEDIDGKMVLNSLACISKDEIRGLLKFLLGNVLESSSDEICKKDPKIFAKYDWLISYIKDFLSISGLMSFDNYSIKR